MRFIGISCIILAHVLGPGSLLFNLRSFDVPLMVFVSGLANARKNIPSYGAFVKRRILRLIVPVWIFYTLYFIILYLTSLIGTGVTFPSGDEIIRTYLCLEGYGWIIRVFVLITFITPLLVIVEQKVQNPIAYLSIVLGLLFLSSILTTLLKEAKNPIVKDLWEGCFLFLLGYTPAFMSGLRMRYSKEKERYLYAVLFTIAVTTIFLSPAIPFDLEHFKWPPQYPFMIYGIAVSCIIWLCQPLLEAMAQLRPLVFIGQNTIWIYLWHILALLFVFKTTHIWWLQFTIVYCFCITIFFFQHRIYRHIPEDFIFKKYLIG